jgi:hypothetical protein
MSDDLIKRLRAAELNHNEWRWGWLAECVDRLNELQDALNDACLTYAVHGDQPPAKWLKALEK